MKISPIFLLSVLILSSLFTFEVSAKSYKFRYTIEEGDSLGKIIRKFLKNPRRKLNAKEPFIRKIIRKNSHIQTWSDLFEGSVLRLFLPTSIANKKKIVGYLKKQKLKRRRKRKVREEEEQEEQEEEEEEDYQDEPKEKRVGRAFDFSIAYRFSKFSAQEKNSVGNADIAYNSIFGMNFDLSTYSRESDNPWKNIFGLEFAQISSDQYSYPMDIRLWGNLMKYHMFWKASPWIGLEYQQKSHLAATSSSTFKEKKTAMTWLDFGLQADWKLNNSHTFIALTSFAWALAAEGSFESVSAVQSLDATRLRLGAKYKLKNWFIYTGLSIIAFKASSTTTIDYSDMELLFGYAF